MPPYLLANYPFSGFNPVVPGGTKEFNQVLPCAQQNGNGNGKLDKLTLRITNLKTTKGLASIFDASGKFQNQFGVESSTGILIEGMNTDYQNVLNDLASGEQYCIAFTEFDIIYGAVASQQEQPWLIKQIVRFTKGQNLLQQIEPGYYKDPYQQQANRLTVKEGFSITRQRLMEIEVEPETSFLLKMTLSQALLNG